MTMQSDIGLIGLAVMGENLALNMESKGFSVAVFNRTTAVTEKFVTTRGKGKKITSTKTIEQFIGALKRPRKAMMMIKAGKPVDQVIGEVVPLLEKGDVLIDGGNSLFTDTQRRFHHLEMDSRCARKLSHRDYLGKFSQTGSRYRQTASRCHPR